MAEEQDRRATEDSYTSTDTATVQLLHRETGAVLYEKEITAFRLEPATEEGARRGRALAVRQALDDGVSLAYADLSHLDLSGWDLSASDFRCADLTGSDLHGSNLDRSDFRGSTRDGMNMAGTSTLNTLFGKEELSRQLNAAQEGTPDNDRPPTPGDELDALHAFKADAATKNAAHEAYRAAWTAQVAEAFANSTATVDKTQAGPEAAPEADPLPRSRDDIVEGARHSAREQAAAGGSKIDQYGLAMEAAERREAAAAIPAHEAERAELAAKGVALEGSLAAAWAKLEAKTPTGERAALRAAMVKARGTDAPAAAVPPREGWQEHMAATLEGSRTQAVQTPGERERAALRARKAEAQARSGQSRGFEP